MGNMTKSKMKEIKNRATRVSKGVKILSLILIGDSLHSYKALSANRDRAGAKSCPS